MKIELKKDTRRTDPIRGGGQSWPKNRGGFEIFIDGKLWGRTQQKGHGCHGSTHELLQISGNRDYNACTVERRGFGRQQERLSDRRTPIKIWSEKQYLRNLKAGEPRVWRLADRIKAMVADAIEGGWFRDPAVIDAEIAKGETQRRATEAKVLQEANVAFEARAREAIGPAKFALTPTAEADLVKEIVAAMRWAQSK